MEDELRAHLLSLANAFATAERTSLRTIGKRALNDNTFFHRIEQGDGFNVKTFDRLVAWFACHWPQGCDWPAGIPRSPQTGVAA